MRLSELRGLSWGDVDLNAGEIHVRQRAAGWQKLGPTKSKAGMRDIPLAPMVINTLKQWRLECPNGNLGLVFSNTVGNIETMSNIHARCWVPLQQKCFGEARYGLHMLRHAAASLFIKYLNWSPKRLQAAMGHASIKYDLRPLRPPVRKRRRPTAMLGKDRGGHQGGVVRSTSKPCPGSR
jgi:integrase